jgi:hypothetical protein
LLLTLRLHKVVDNGLRVLGGCVSIDGGCVQETGGLAQERQGELLLAIMLLRVVAVATRAPHFHILLVQMLV